MMTCGHAGCPHPATETIRDYSGERWAYDDEECLVLCEKCTDYMCKDMDIPNKYRRKWPWTFQDLLSTGGAA